MKGPIIRKDASDKTDTLVIMSFVCVVFLQLCAKEGVVKVPVTPQGFACAILAGKGTSAKIASLILDVNTEPVGFQESVIVDQAGVAYFVTKVG